MKSSESEPPQQQKPLEEKPKISPTGRDLSGNWRPWGDSGNFEVNDAGQVRTKNYPLPK